MSYRDEETLRKLYVDERLSYKEIAEKFDVHQATIGKWVNRFDIIRPYQDPEVLEELYLNQGLSTAEVSERLDCCAKTISNQLHKHNIKVRNPSDERPVYHGIDNKGYEMWRTTVDGRLLGFSVHRLLAISEFGPDVVKGKSVHHINGIPWDNRPENLEVMTQSEHIKEKHKDENGRFIPVTNVE